MFCGADASQRPIAEASPPRHPAGMEADDGAEHERDELLSRQQNFLSKAVIQFVLIPLAVAAIMAVLGPVADWIRAHR
jgi:hypothetical protein